MKCLWINRQRCSLAYLIVTAAIKTHWGRVTYICVGNLTIIGSDNGLSPGRRQAIIWTNVGILLIGPIGTNFSEMVIKIHTFPFKKIHLKMSSGKWRPFCLGLNVLRYSQFHRRSADWSIQNRTTLLMSTSTHICVSNNFIWNHTTDWAYGLSQ